MGNQPNPDEIPVELDDLPEEIQSGFDLYTKLPDRWDSFNGTYLGKDLTCLGVILDIKQVEDRATALDLILMIDAAREQQLAKKRKQAEQQRKKK